jgi:hypothetical protein
LEKDGKKKMKKTVSVAILVLLMFTLACSTITRIVGDVPVEIGSAEPTLIATVAVSSVATSQIAEIEPTMPIESGSLAEGVPGLMEDDVIQIVEEIGLKCEESAKLFYGFQRLCHYEDGAEIAWVVSILGRNPSQIIQLQITVAVPPDDQLNIEKATEFLILMAGLNYDGATPQAAQKWVEKNINLNLANVDNVLTHYDVFGGVKFKLTPGPLVAQLVIGDDPPRQ